MTNNDSTLPKRCKDCGIYLKEALLNADAENILPE